MMEYIYGKEINMQSLGRTIAWRNTTATQMAMIAQHLKVVGHRKSCPICSCTSAEDYAEFYNIIYRQCSNCGHLYHYQIIDEHYISKRYEGENNYLDYIVDEKYFQQRVEMIATPKVDYISKHVECPSGAEWLDIGCGAGELLLAAKMHGWQVRGIETSNIGIRQGNKLGFTVNQQYVTQDNAANLLNNSYLISLTDVLEHLPDPLSIVNIISKNAKNCKYIVIEVPRHPSLSALSAKMFPQSVVRHLIIPDHIHIFTEKSIKILLDKCNFEITHCWKYGQDFYEVMSMLTQQANQEIDIWPSEIFTAINDVQMALDRNNLSDSMLLISKRKQN